MSTIELAAVIAGVLSLGACGKGRPPAELSKTQANASAGAAKPFTTAAVFPPGPGRDLVLNNCGSCHSVLCAARGQRTKERWESVKKDHADKLAGSGADLNTTFAYLEANFNDSRPEPQVPAELLAQGCTPF